jgi:hypothetical protein
MVKRGLNADFRVDEVIVKFIDLRQDLGALPKTRSVTRELVFKAFGQPERGLIVSDITEALVDEAGTEFTRECCIRFFEEIITNTRTDGETVLQVGDAVMQRFHAGITIKLVGEQMIVLAEAMDGIHVFLAAAGAVSPVSAEADFIVGRLPMCLCAARDQQGGAVAARQGEAGGHAAFPRIFRRLNNLVRCGRGIRFRQNIRHGDNVGHHHRHDIGQGDDVGLRERVQGKCRQDTGDGK